MTMDTGALAPEEVRNVFDNIGWGLREKGTTGARKLREIVQGYPENVQDLMTGAPGFAINHTARIWGTVSIENTNRANIRLVADTPDRLREGAEILLDSLSPTFKFNSSVVIRRHDGEVELQRGTIVQVGALGWVKYLRSKRRREWKLLMATLSGFVICIAAAAAMFALRNGDYRSNWAYARMAIDRISTAFLIAFVTTAINSFFEYSEWRAANFRIEWGV